MNSDESPAVVELPDDAIKALVEAASGIDIMPELLARVPEAVEYVDAWRKTLIDNGSLREESPTNEFLGVVTIAATWAVNGVIAAHVRAEAVAEHRAEQRHWIEVGQQVEAEKRVAEAERDEYRRNWREAEKRTANAVAEAVAGERQRVAAAIHERGMAYRERIGPAVDQSDWHGRFLYGLFCAEEIALGPAAGSVPVATPEPIARDERPHSRACGLRRHEHGSACAVDCPTCAAGGGWHYPVATRLQPGRVGFGTDAFEAGGSLPGHPVATPTEPARRCLCGHRAADHLNQTGRCTEDNDRDWTCPCQAFAASPVFPGQPHPWFRETPESLALLEAERAEVAAVEAAAEQSSGDREAFDRRAGEGEAAAELLGHRLAVGETAEQPEER